MLAPQPERTSGFPKPSRIISKSALFRAWKSSRDSTRNSGRPGVNNVSADQFSAKLDPNLGDIVRRLRNGSYGFSKLRAVFIPKPHSDKERLICIPVVQDRLVQRVISDYLTTQKIFPIYNSSSYGFIKGRGTREAINAVVKLRAKYEWCLKTDIESFFDRIPRRYLKEQVYRYLKRHSLTPLLYSIIDSEIKVTEGNRQKFIKQNIAAGRGVRQGMPLSPLLSNLALAEFDKKIERLGIEMVRYADDLVLFFPTKQAACEGEQQVKSLLKEIQLTIPQIYDGSKTAIVSKGDPLDFLGREIVYLGSENRFVARVSSKQIEKIRARLSEEYAYSKRIKEEKNFQETIVDLSKSIAAYLGIYGDAHNFKSFEDEIRGHGRVTIIKIFEALFGQQALTALDKSQRKFLGIGILDAVEPNPELNV